LAWINAALLHFHVDPARHGWMWAGIGAIVLASHVALKVLDEPIRRSLRARARSNRLTPRAEARRRRGRVIASRSASLDRLAAIR
jgi:peptidoglycan/LPS O-acetylase OafA/YrhL